MSKRKHEEKTEKETIEKKQKLENETECPYLDTINKKVLDFDFEKQCSETLANFNVYCCLVCGKYFQGRGNKTPAYFHSLQENHYVFLNVNSSKVYCIPDDYEINHPSLNDIIHNLSPKYTEKDIQEIDSLNGNYLSLQKQKFIPGFVGLNNLKNTSGFNVVIQTLTKIPKFRNFLLSWNSKNETPILNSFSELTKKIWNAKNFKNHVSPHEFLQVVHNSKKFEIGKVVDPFLFLVWLLNSIHFELSKSKVLTKRSIITDIFRGEIKMISQIVPVKEDSDEKLSIPQSKNMPFLSLTLDIPQTPLFKDKLEKNQIPQVPLVQLLAKFDGKNEILSPISDKIEKKKFQIEQLPECLIVHVKRFTKNNWSDEKNPTIVNFPVKNLDLRDCCKLPEHFERTKYDLIANICHEGKNGKSKVHLHNSNHEKYYEIIDLFVKEILPQEIAISESYIQFYLRK
eukprot:gene6841-11002_t